MKFKGQNRRMFRPPGLARQAIGILASSRELMNEAQPMRMANGGDVSVSPMPRPMPRPTRDFGEIPNVVRQMPMIGQEEVPYTRQPPDLDYVNALRSESSLYSDIISEFERGKLGRTEYTGMGRLTDRFGQFKVEDVIDDWFEDNPEMGRSYLSYYNRNRDDPLSERAFKRLLEDRYLESEILGRRGFRGINTSEVSTTSPFLFSDFGIEEYFPELSAQRQRQEKQIELYKSGVNERARESRGDTQEPLRMANGGDVNIIETYLDQARRMAEAQGLRPGSMLYNQVVGTLYNQLSSTKPSVSQLFPPRAPEPQPVDVSTPMSRQAFPGRGVGSFRGLQTPDVDSAPLGAPEPQPVDVSTPMSRQAFPRRGVGSFQGLRSPRVDSAPLGAKQPESTADMLGRISSIISPPTGVGPDSIRALEREREKPRRMTSVERREAKRPGGDPTRVQDPFYTLATIGRSPEGKELTTARAEQRRGSTVPEEVEAQEAQAAEVTERLKEEQEAVERKAAAQAGDAPAVSTVDAPAVPDTTTKPFVVDITPKEQEVIAPEYQKFLQMVISGGGNMQEADKNFYLMMFGLTTAAGESDNPLLNITKAARDTLLAYATEKRDIEKSNFVRRLEASKALADIKLAEAKLNEPGSLEKNFALVREKLPNLPVEEQLIIAGGGKKSTDTDAARYENLAKTVGDRAFSFTQNYIAKNKEAPADVIKQLRQDATQFIAATTNKNPQIVETGGLKDLLTTFGLTPIVLEKIGIAGFSE